VPEGLASSHEFRRLASRGIVKPRCVFNYLALPVTARNGHFRFPKLNVGGSNPISRAIVGVGSS
jgi:hypothetical protein